MLAFRFLPALTHRKYWCRPGGYVPAGKLLELLCTPRAERVGDEQPGEQVEPANWLFIHSV